MYKLLIEWLRIKLNIPYEREEFICETCEALKLENAHLREDNKFILTQLFNSSRTEEVKSTETFKPILPKRQNWHTERTRLERESLIKENNRIRDIALKAAGHTDAQTEDQKREEATNIVAPSNDILGSKKSIEELEKELSVEFPPINEEKVG